MDSDSQVNHCCELCTNIYPSILPNTYTCKYDSVKHVCNDSPCHKNNTNTDLTYNTDNKVILVSSDELENSNDISNNLSQNVDNTGSDQHIYNKDNLVINVNDESAEVVGNTDDANDNCEAGDVFDYSFTQELYIGINNDGNSGYNHIIDLHSVQTPSSELYCKVTPFTNLSSAQIITLD